MRTTTNRGKAFLKGFLLFLMAYWLLFDRNVANRGDITVGATTTTSNEKLKHWKWNEREIDSVDDQLESKRLVYVSKRRVPNGPDPIHNRREVKTKQPPSA